MEKKIKVYIEDKPEYIDAGATCDACYVPLEPGDKLCYATVVNYEDENALLYDALVHEECANDALSEIWWSSNIDDSEAKYVLDRVANYDEDGNITNPKTVKKEMIKEYRRQKYPKHSVYSAEELYIKYWGWITEEGEDY